MKKVNMHGIDFTDISEHDLADYIERLYSNRDFHDALFQAENIDKCRYYTNILSEIMVKYAISTGDLSMDNVKEIVNNVMNNRNKKRYNNPDEMKIDRFNDSAYPCIVEYWKKKLGRNDDSLQTTIDIVTAVSIQNRLNGFLTHSFNGALENNVRENGLNIHNEMFKENYQELLKVSADHYRVGELLFCELSEATYGYMHKSPERLWMKLNMDFKQNVDESLREYGYRCLDELLPDDDQKDIKESVGEMVDFYTSNDNSCIAIRKRNTAIDDGYAQKEMERLSSLAKFGLNLPFTITRKIPKELKDKYLQTLRDKNSTLNDIEILLDEMSNVSEEVREDINKIKAAAGVTLMCKWGIANYLHNGNVDGYRVEGGKLSNKEFALASFKNPVNVYIECHKELYKPLK